jgi:GT2 family glycosyltransferase
MLTTAQGWQVWIDRRVLELWTVAQGRTLEEVLQTFQPKDCTQTQMRAGLACLAQADLLRRTDPSPPTPVSAPPDCGRVSAILVGYNSRPWLEGCLASLASQSCPPDEILFADNGPQDGSADWLLRNYPQVRQIDLAGRGSLARALNTAVRAAQGDYLLLLNPDVCLQRDALAHMIAAARNHPDCAAVAPKLRLLSAPAFLNGLGNLVGKFSWGTDLGLGHLDLGQFDHWEKLPSACFAAALISSWAIQAVGTFDEGFPLYYEDSEWCYRARLLGFDIRAAPDALAEHAFGALPGERAALKPEKLQQVTYGRLRWITRINGRGYFWGFLCAYLAEDLIRLAFYLLQGKWRSVRAVWRGWRDYLRALSALLPQRRILQARRRITDRQLFELQRGAPVLAVRAGYPQLTWDRIVSDYLPLICTNPDLALPEIDPGCEIPTPGTLRRLVRIVKIEGVEALVYWIGRNLVWRLMQP